jgi:hypothetical protein
MKRAFDSRLDVAAQYRFDNGAIVENESKVGQVL